MKRECAAQSMEYSNGWRIQNGWSTQDSFDVLDDTGLVQCLKFERLKIQDSISTVSTLLPVP